MRQDSEGHYYITVEEEEVRDMKEKIDRSKCNRIGCNRKSIDKNIPFCKEHTYEFFDYLIKMSDMKSPPKEWRPLLKLLGIKKIKQRIKQSVNEAIKKGNVTGEDGMIFID